MKSILKTKYVAKGLLALVAAGAIASCKPSLKEFIPSNGQADFSRYLAVGNSLSAGYADGGLYLDGQKNAMPEMLAAQMKTAGGGEFNSPFFSEAQENGSGYIELSGFTATGGPITTPVTTKLAWDAAKTVLTKYEGTFNNYGTPDIKLAFYNTRNYAASNPQFARLLGSSLPTSTYLEVIAAQKFTFFTFWEGHNDLLGYGYSGGSQPLTSEATFRTLYNNALQTLTANGAKGVVGTIGDILAIPYFKVVTLQALQASVASVVPNATFYVRTGTGTTRAADATDMFTIPLSTSGRIGVPDSQKRPYGLHPGNPIANNYVLDRVEQTNITNRTKAYNAIIKEAAAAKGLAIADIDEVMTQYYTPKMVNGAAVSTAYITGNLFSLDGIHLTPFGNALTTNAFIKTINEHYKANLPIVNIAHYRGVKFPANSTQK
jgi:phospholipase/lecithinase/hemolysin